MIFTSIYGVVDGFFVSNFVGKTPFAAVNFIFVAIFVGYATGAAPVVSYHYGAGNTKELNDLLKKSISLILVTSVVMFAAAFFFTQSDAFLLNLLFYIIITPIITVTLNKIMFASENKMIVGDALERVDSILVRQPLPEAAKSTQKKELKDKSVSFDNVSFRYEGALRSKTAP